jgi:vacuolar-type H+-ATPase subunit I/STV1
MINSLLTVIYNMIAWIIGLFPSGSGFPSSWHTAVSSLGGYLHILDPLVPINILLACVTAVFGVEIAIFGFKTLKWIMSHIPYIGGHGA